MEAINADPSASMREIARRVGVYESTVRRVVAAMGGYDTMEDRRMVVLPEGRTMSEVCAEGLAREREGLSPEAAIVDLGISIRGYRVGRDLMQLKRNPRLTEVDCARVTAAIAEMDATRTPFGPAERVMDLIHSTWGSMRGMHHDDERRERFLEGYMHAVTVVADSAHRLTEMDIPYLGIAERREARAACKRAMRALRHIAKTLNGGVA